MTEQLKFFSPEWCEAAMKACNASEAMYQGFKDPKSFTNRMEFGVNERDDLKMHMEWQEARIIEATTAKYPEDDLWLKIYASLDTWAKAASGRTEGGQLLLAGKIKFIKGPMSAAIENAGAFNNFLRAWGEVPTDWAV